MTEAKPSWFEKLQAPVLPRELKIRYAEGMTRIVETESRMELEEAAKRRSSEPPSYSISHLREACLDLMPAHGAIAREAYQFALANEPQLAGRWKAAFLGSFPPGVKGLAERLRETDDEWLELILGTMFLGHSLQLEKLPPDLKERLRRLKPPGK